MIEKFSLSFSFQAIDREGYRGVDIGQYSVNGQ